MLLVALASGGWQCKQEAGLWQCQSPPPAVKLETPPTVAEVTPGQLPETAPEPAPVTGPAGELAEDPMQAPPQEAEPVKAMAPAPVSSPVAERAPDSEAVASAEPEPKPEANVADPYLVQIGAYREKSAARQQASRVDSSELEIMPTRRDGKDWYVVLLGAFPSWQEANDAGRAYESAYGGSFWVRRSSDLRKVLREDAD